MFRQIFLCVSVLLSACFAAHAETPPPEIRVGVLAFGTVNWELAAMENEGLSRSAAFRLAATSLASPEAAKIALLGGTVDVIVADWIWVARQREQGLEFTFAPYSTSHGALMVPADSPIRSLADLKGKRLGVVGGGIDKNWLLLQALAQQKYQIDLAREAEVVFGAPPLLNQQLLQGRLDALLNYWHYAAKLEALQYRQILDGRALLRELGVGAELANLGYVFRSVWAERNDRAWRAFLKVSEQARNTLCDKDAAWRKVVPLTGETDPATLKLLRLRYCNGRIKQWGDAEVSAARQVFGLLRATGGGELTGKSLQLPAGVFWPFPHQP